MLYGVAQQVQLLVTTVLLTHCLACPALCPAHIHNLPFARAFVIFCSQSVKNAELQRSRVLQELGSMLRVQHHPHAVRLLEVYEDARAYNLVMPLLKGVCVYV